MAAKTLFSMQITQTQKEIMEYLIEFRYQGQASKAYYLTNLVMEDALGFLNLPNGFMNEFSEEDMLEELKGYALTQKEMMIDTMGEMRYQQLIEKYHTDKVIKDTKTKDK